MLLSSTILAGCRNQSRQARCIACFGDVQRRSVQALEALALPASHVFAPRGHICAAACPHQLKYLRVVLPVRVEALPEPALRRCGRLCFAPAPYRLALLLLCSLRPHGTWLLLIAVASTLGNAPAALGVSGYPRVSCWRSGCHVLGLVARALGFPPRPCSSGRGGVLQSNGKTSDPSVAPAAFCAPVRALAGRSPGASAPKQPLIARLRSHCAGPVTVESTLDRNIRRSR